MKKPRRTKKSAAARMRPFWILILLAAVAAGAGGYYAANWPGFRLHRVRVSGNARVATSQIVARAALDPRANVWLTNTRAARARIEGLPYIATVRLRRSLPADVLIEVTERRPFAIVRDGAVSFLIDRAGRVLEAGPANVTGLPVFVERLKQVAVPGSFLKDARTGELARDYETLRDAHAIARELSFDRLGNLEAVLPGGVVAKLGDDADLADKAQLVEPILSQTQREGRRIRTVDLRAPKTPVVVYQ